MRKWLVGLLAAALCASSAWADDELTRETTGVTGSSYTEWTATGDSGAKYAGQSAGGNESIQLRAQSPAGIVMTESSGSDVASVTVEWNDATAEKRSVEIYGSTSAYAGPADLYGDGKGTLLGTIARTATTLEVPEGYPYIGILAKGGALYLSSVTIGFAGSGEFSVTFDKANWFEVEQGTASSVTAIAKNGAEPYTYEWSCDKSELLTGTEATLAIPDTLEADDYTLACLVTDADLNAINALIGLRVVAPKAKFPVTVAEGIEHGTVTVDKEEAIEGEIVTVTATAEAGYKLDSLTYNGTAISGNTFAMPGEAVEVNATFVEKPAVSGDELTRETTGVTGSSYTEWTATGDSGAKYAGQSAGGNESIQLRAQSPAGIVITESAGSDVASVTVEWNDATAEKRSLEIYGSTTAYAGPADLYGDGKGTLLGTIARTDTTLEVPEGYPYVGILAKGGALYLTSVVIDFAGRGEFSVTFDKENWFEVEQGTASSVTAIARNGAEPYTYEWSCDQSELLTGTEATLAIPDTLEAGDYSLFCLVTDADSNAINAGIGLRVVEPKAKFPVTVAEGIEHGTVTVDKEEAIEGEIVTVTATAEAGYKLDSLTYNGTAISGNTFAMPGEAVEVNATFVEKPAVSGDELTRETTGVEGTNYKDWTATGESGTVYAGNSAGGNESIQLRTTSPAGIVITESAGSDVASVTVEWNDATAEKRSLEIYGSTTAYAGPADLYGDGKGTLLGTIARTDTTLEVPEGYPYVGILAKGGALYLTSVVIDFGGAAAPSVTLSASATEVEVGGPVTITATAKNFSAEVEWSWTGNGTADGATFAVDTSVAGSYEVTATATAGEETASKSVTITVKAPAVKYQIECAVGIPNGSVSADKTEAEEGELVTLAADPADGYKLGTFLLDGDPISGNSFEMPAHDVLVSAEFVEKPVVDGDELTRETTGVTGSSYTEWTATGDSGAKYAGQSAGGNESIQLRSQSPAGIVMTESSGSDVASVTVEWNDATAEKRSLEIYGSTTAYAGPADLYGESKGTLLGTIARTDTTLEVPEGYPYIGILAKGGALYLSSVTIGFAGASGPSVSLSASATEVEVGEPVTITATAKNFSAEVDWSWTGNGTADGATFAVDTSVAGSYEVTATATAGEETASKSVTITVKAPAVKYQIECAVGIPNGSVSADKTEAEEGELVTLAADPADGYKLGTFLLDGDPISGNSFEMPAHDVLVSAEFVEKPPVTGDVLTNDDVGSQSSSYKDWTATKDSGAVYAGQTAGGSATNPCIQLRSSNNSGIVMTKDSGQNISSVTIEWNAQSAAERVVQVYGSATAYSSPADLYGDAKGTLLAEFTNGSGEVTVDVAAVGEFPYIGIRSKSGALYLTSVAIDFGGAAAFSIALDPAEDFEVPQGTDAAITATVRGAQGDVTYSWSVNGTPIDLAGNVYAIDSAEVGGPYEVVCEASDGVSDPVSASVSYSVVEVPPVTGDEFTLITSVDDLEDGAEYVITDNSQAYAIKSVLSDGSTKRLLNESVTPVEGVITTDDASIIWKLVAVEGGSFAFYNDSIGKYIGWSSGNSAKFQDDAFANTISYEDNLFVVMATSTAELEKPRKLQFNSASTSLQFAYYEGTQKNLCFFKKSDGPGPQPGEPALVFGGDSEGTVDTPVNFTVEAINMANTDIYGGWTEHEGLFDAPEGSALSDAGVTQDFPNVSFTPDVAGQYVFYFNAGEGDEYREGSWTVTVTGEGPGPQPSDAAITKMTIASGKMTIEFTGTAPQVLLSDDMQTWTAVDGAISPFEFNMDEAGKKYIGVR